MRRLYGLLALLTSAPLAPAADEPDTLHLVFLGQPRPVLVRLHVQIDGQPFQTAYRAAWEDYVRALFRQLDQNGDGFLTDQEATRLPAATLTVGDAALNISPVRRAFNILVVDEDDNGKLDLQEVLKYYRDYGGWAQLQPPRATGVPAAVSAGLFTRLDKDQDGKLSRAELAAAPDLMALDADGDGVLDTRELASERSLAPGVEAATRMVARPRPADLSPRFALVTRPEEVDALVARLLRQYGSGSRLRERLLGPTDLNLDAADFRQLDADGDGTLDTAELRKFLTLRPDVELRIRLGKTTDGQAPVQVVDGGGKTPAAVRQIDDGGLLLTVGNTRIEWNGNVLRPVPLPRTRSLYLEQFRAADRAGKGHLLLKDAHQHNFFPNQFALLDQNGDGKLTEAEVAAYLDQVQARQATAVTSVVAVLVSEEGRGLFELLDRNRDGRLGLRELRAAPQLLDRTAADALSRDAVPVSFQVAIGLGRTGFDRVAGAGVFSPPGMPLLTLDGARQDLIWFQKMDRNGDGDVSPAEFLGNRQQFQRIDADGDGLISLNEAVRQRRP